MKQILQNVRSGEIQVADVPAPQVSRGGVLIQTAVSVISAGTERMLVEFSKASLLQKARQKPEQVQLVLDMMKSDGILPTLEAVFRKLDEPLPLGYCNAGVILEVGEDVQDLRPGDQVVSNGPHAEIVQVPRHLCTKIPEGVSNEQAAFTVLGSIALQGIRLTEPSLGEKFIVMGLGLVGLLTVQLLRANGCEVLGVDLNPDRLKLAEAFGAQTVNIRAGGDPIDAARGWTRGRGVDGVLITAATDSHDLIHQAAQSCRKRGRIVLVGVTGLNLQRNDFFEKELTFQVSCSYGPGRYDEAYEQMGRDYPYGFVRWTEQRNFDAVLGAMAAGTLQVGELITDRIAQVRAVEAYEKIQSDSNTLGVVLTYPEKVDSSSMIVLSDSSHQAAAAQAVIGLIGAGNFTNAVLAPALAKTQARIAYVGSRGGVSAQGLARQFRAEKAVSDYQLILDDPAVNAVIITLQHHLHARVVCEALQADKHVFVEKPLCLNAEELEQIQETYAASCDSASSTAPILMVGFNRRFSPHTVAIRKAIAKRSEPMCMNVTVNGGAIPAAHWVQDPSRGGGRIVGEACHFIDLMLSLVGSPISSVSAMMVGNGPEIQEDKMAITLGFKDGSIGTINYFSNGTKGYPKERLDVFSDGRIFTLDNFRVTRAYGAKGFQTIKTLRQDKGHREEMRQFVEAISEGGVSPIRFQEISNVTHASFAAVVSAREGRWVRL